MLFADAALKEEGAGQPSLVTLPHPREGGGALYLVVPHTHQLFEVCQFTDEPRCWIAEDILIKGSPPQDRCPSCSLTPRHSCHPLLQMAACSCVLPWTPSSWHCHTSSELHGYTLQACTVPARCHGNTTGPTPQGGSFASLGDILEDHAFPDVRLLQDLIPHRQWDNISSTKGRVAL